MYENQFEIVLEIAGYCPKTQITYIRHLKNYFTYLNKIPNELKSEEIEKYLYYLATEKKISQSYLNGAYSALKIFYERVLKLNWKAIKLPRMKNRKRLPYILDETEVKKLIECTKNLKHRTILMVTYSAGLRVSETANLTVSDIDSKRMQIRVNQGKGKKDRYTILSEFTLNLLRDYWKYYRPRKWLFPGIPLEKAISSRSIQRIFEKAKQQAGIKKPVSVHSLRHSFATHLLESGTDIYYIQQLLGHTSLRTTSIYIHLKRNNVLKIASPLDHIYK